MPEMDTARHRWSRSFATRIGLSAALLHAVFASDPASPAKAAKEIQVTHRPTGHLLTNINVWSPDGRWIVYDTRSDAAGEKFDGDTIEIVNVETGEVREVYRARNGAHCGVATFSPKTNRVVFILGPEHPTDDWQYGAWHRQGVLVDVDKPGQATPLDARDITPPFTPGALRGGSHVHVFDGDGEWVSFTYEDHILATLDASGAVGHDANQRNVGVSVPVRSVRVPANHPRNRGGAAFSVVVTRTVNQPRPGSDEISRAFEEAWVGTHGYARWDGTRQRHALAFQGNVVTSTGATISEVFVVDIPDDVTLAGEAPLVGTATTRPAPPRGTRQRRITFTADRKYPGLQGPRHWLRSSADGTRIAFFMRDDAGIVQLWTISPNGGQPRQLTQHPFDIASAFSWSPDGRWIAYAADNSIFVTDTANSRSTRLTPRSEDSTAPRPEACVISPDGRRIAFVRPFASDGGVYNQIFVVEK
jgi:dipeptidyl aminopeptidase/acylaminoacyl peptidase